jgi:hypothetical protein
LAVAVLAVLAVAVVVLWCGSWIGTVGSLLVASAVASAVA